MFKRRDKQLFLLVFLMVIFVDLEIRHLYFSSKFTQVRRLLPRSKKLTQVPLSSKLMLSKVPLKFSRKQPDNSPNPMVGIYEKLVENLTFFDRMANTNNSKVFKNIKILAPWDQKTYTNNITECFSDSNCTKYQSFWESYLANLEKVLKTSIDNYVENEKFLLLKNFHSLLRYHTKLEENLITALKYITLDYKTDQNQREFNYDTLKRLLERSIQLPEREMFVDAATEYDPNNEYNRTVIGSKDHKVLCLHKNHSHNVTANETIENNVTGLMCQGGVFPVKIDKTKMICRQLDAVFSKNVKNLTRNYVYDKATKKKKFVYNEKWNDGTSSPSLGDKTCIVLGSSGIIKKFTPSFKKYMDRSDVVFFHVNQHNYENGYRKLKIIGQNNTLRPCYRTHSCGYFLRFASGKEDYYGGSFPDTCGLNNLVFRTISAETCTAVPPRIPNKWPPGANFSTISVDALQVFLARRIATNVYAGYLTSGTLIALKALNSCKKVHVYGMYGLKKDVYGNDLPYSFSGYENDKIFVDKGCGSCALDTHFFSVLNDCFENFNFYI
jgi:hypothetical protein